MRLLPRLRRYGEGDPVKEELAARKRALKDRRSRRKVATPMARLRPEEIPAGAIVFQKHLETFEGTPADPVVETAPDSPRQTPDTAAEAPPAAAPAEAALDGLELEQAASVAPSPEAEAAPPPPADPLGGGDDMLDIFREAKSEASAGGLASEVEDISIAELLGDLNGITARLGIPKRQPVVHQVQSELEVIEVEAETEPEIKVEKIVPQLAVEGPPAPDPEPVPELVDDIDFGSLLAREEPETAPGKPAEPERATLSGHARPKRGIDGNMMMHLVFLGLALSAAGAFGLMRVHRPNAALGVENADKTGGGIVLAVVLTPAPTFAPAGTKAPTASPTPAPTPVVTPSPTPRVKDPSIPPAYTTYQVEYGDTITSIAAGFGICPDHVLWANDRDENTPLYAGDELLIPDGPGIIHTVRAGDTLSSIARLYNTSIDAIAGAAGNQVTTSEDLVPGDKIFVPGGVPPSALDLGSKAEKRMSKASSAGLVWPFYGPITTYFGEQRVGYVHNAIDIGGLGHYGASVDAVADGTVAFVGSDSEYGQNVIVIHPDGSRTRYAHFSRVYVSQGDEVSQGQALGALGCSGDSTGTHLHFELWKGDRPVDPLIYLTPA
jgi:LysM repeat protein